MRTIIASLLAGAALLHEAPARAQTVGIEWELSIQQISVTGVKPSHERVLLPERTHDEMRVLCTKSQEHVNGTDFPTVAITYDRGDAMKSDRTMEIVTGPIAHDSPDWQAKVITPLEKFFATLDTLCASDVDEECTVLAKDVVERLPDWAACEGGTMEHDGSSTAFVVKHRDRTTWGVPNTQVNLEIDAQRFVDERIHDLYTPKAAIEGIHSGMDQGVSVGEMRRRVIETLSRMTWGPVDRRDFDARRKAVEDEVARLRTTIHQLKDEIAAAEKSEEAAPAMDLFGGSFEEQAAAVLQATEEDRGFALRTKLRHAIDRLRGLEAIQADLDDELPQWHVVSAFAKQWHKAMVPSSWDDLTPLEQALVVLYYVELNAVNSWEHNPGFHRDDRGLDWTMKNYFDLFPKASLDQLLALDEEVSGRPLWTVLTRIALADPKLSLCDRPTIVLKSVAGSAPKAQSEETWCADWKQRERGWRHRLLGDKDPLYLKERKITNTVAPRRTDGGSIRLVVESRLAVNPLNDRFSLTFKSGMPAFKDLPAAQLQLKSFFE